MRFFWLIFCWQFFHSCDHSAEKPVWLNETSEFIFPYDTFHFQSSSKDWSAVLYSFTQPVELTLEPERNGFRIVVDRNSGIVEGPANLSLTSGKNTFFYAINLVKIEDSFFQLVDYRSPKTVNPDSSLQHQSIMHKVDRFQNLKTVIDEKYFFEREHSLSPIVKTYRAIIDKALTAYYMQAGSCAQIPLQSIFDEEKNQFNISAGILKDKYGNNIADGSVIRFIYTDSKNTYRQESLVKKGFANAQIPWKKNLKFKLHAETNNVQSNIIELSHSINETAKIIKIDEVKKVRKALVKPLIEKQPKSIVNQSEKVYSKTLEIDE